MKKGYITFMLLLTIVSLLFAPPLIRARTLTHIVEKGDTLWDLCEKYYGDPELWPKLWQMNPFITNPHLLNPGDVITLFEEPPVKETKPPEVAEEVPPAIPTEPEPEVMGIGLEGLTEVNALGYLSHKKIRPWGTIFATDSSRILLSGGDIVFVIFDESRQIIAGDEFSIGNVSPLLKHPITGENLGYVFTICGRLTVEKRLGLAHRDKRFYNKQNVYQARIIEAFEPIQIDQVVMPFRPLSQCVMPVHYSGELVTNIVASRGTQIILKKNSVVYIDAGSNQGVARGNIFQVVKTNLVPDPKPEEEDIFEPEGRLILPDIPIGTILVLESMPNTSTALVLSATEPFSTGAYVKNMAWPETRDLISSRLNCPVD